MDLYFTLPMKLSSDPAVADDDNGRTTSQPNESLGLFKITIVRQMNFKKGLKLILSEIIGTAWLMIFGCLGVFADTVIVKPVPPNQCATTFGLIVGSIVAATGNISNAHLNPAVTLCFLILELITPLTAFLYLIADIIGAIAGFFLLKNLVPADLYAGYNASAPCGFCGTCLSPGLQIWQGFTLEFLATSLLCFVVCSVNARNISDATPLIFFILVTVLSMTVGPFTGASMNPARTLAPALANQVWSNHWVYWTAPLLGSATTTYLYKLFFQTKSWDQALEDMG